MAVAAWGPWEAGGERVQGSSTGCTPGLTQGQPEPDPRARGLRPSSTREGGTKREAARQAWLHCAPCSPGARLGAALPHTHPLPPPARARWAACVRPKAQAQGQGPTACTPLGARTGPHTQAAVHGAQSQGHLTPGLSGDRPREPGLWPGPPSGNPSFQLSPARGAPGEWRTFRRGRSAGRTLWGQRPWRWEGTLRRRL